jgi:TetR/AcrR family transcriptional regulator, transcriptional repressor of aconitase
MDYLCHVFTSRTSECKSKENDHSILHSPTNSHLVKSECSFYIWGMARVSQQHLDARRQQILDAARRCFITNGFHNTSMQDILSEANLSSGGLYRYFRSKEEIIIAIAQHEMTSLSGAINATITPDGDLKPVDVIRHMFETLQRADPENTLARMVVQVWSEAVRSQAVAQQVREAFFAALQLLIEQIREYQAEGKIDSGVPAEMIARSIIGVMPGYLLQRAVFGDIDAASYVSAYAALFDWQQSE